MDLVWPWLLVFLYVCQLGCDSLRFGIVAVVEMVFCFVGVVIIWILSDASPCVELLPECVSVPSPSSSQYGFGGGDIVRWWMSFSTGCRKPCFSTHMVLRGWERVAWAWTWVGPGVDLLVGWEGFVLVIVGVVVGLLHQCCRWSLRGFQYWVYMRFSKLVFWFLVRGGENCCKE